jgi:hypothetical protein
LWRILKLSMPCLKSGRDHLLDRLPHAHLAEELPHAPIDLDRVVAFEDDAHALGVLDRDRDGLAAAGALDELKETEETGDAGDAEDLEEVRQGGRILAGEEADDLLVELDELKVDFERAALEPCAHAKRDARIRLRNDGASSKTSASARSAGARSRASIAPSATAWPS